MDSGIASQVLHQQQHTNCSHLEINTFWMAEELSSLILGKHVLTPSLDNWTSHHNTKSGTITPTANGYAVALESGTNPANPPRAITKVGDPANLT